MREPQKLRLLLLLLSVLVFALFAPYTFTSARCLFLSRLTFVRGGQWASFSPAELRKREGSSLPERHPRSTRCLAQRVNKAPQVKRADSLATHEPPSPLGGPPFAGGPPWQGPFCGGKGSRPVIGLPIATAITRSNTTGSYSSSSRGCSRTPQVQQLSSGAYHRLSPSFLGSLLLTLHTNNPSGQPHQLKQRPGNESIPSEQHQQFSGTAEEILVCSRNYEESDADAFGADVDDQQSDALVKGARSTLREELLEVRLQQLLQQQLLPEIAVAGRSNVGKSALLNSIFRLCGSNTGSTSKLPHARSSRTPGRTQAIDLYLFSFAAATRKGQTRQQQQQQQQQGALVVADLPGYGFTKGISPERTRRISRTLEVYIQRRQEQQQQLNQVLLLIDGRRGIGPDDAALLRLLMKLKVQTTLVVTKEDKVNAQQMMDLVQSLSEYKRLVLPPDLLQVRMQLLRQQQQREGSAPSGNNSNRTDPPSPVHAQLRDPLFSPATTESLTQPEQEMEQQTGKQRVPVFVVSARTGTGVKQLWQHVLKSAARFSKERSVSAANTLPRKVAKENVKSTKSRTRAPLRIQPAALPDEFF